jgi:putative SOS response-associated peptidase YedK
VFLTYQLLKELEHRNKPFEFLPRYNAAPMQQLPVVCIRNGKLGVDKMQWWLVPHYAKEFKILTGSDGKPISTFNARAENLEKGKLFSPYFKSARCLVPADAFYEWQKVAVEGKAMPHKQPMCILRKDEKPLMFAGLFSVWTDPTKEIERPSFTIITTTPNTLMEKIHNRMPVILDEKDFGQWLDRDYKDTEKLSKLLKPFPAENMRAYKVSRDVGKASNNNPELMDAIE